MSISQYVVVLALVWNSHFFFISRNKSIFLLFITRLFIDLWNQLAIPSSNCTTSLSLSMSQFFSFYLTKIFFHSLEGHHLHHPHYRLGTSELSLSIIFITSFLHDPFPLHIMIYSWYSILRNPFQQTSSLIQNFMDLKYLPLGLWKNSLSTSLIDLIASTTISVIYP